MVDHCSDFCTWGLFVVTFTVTTLLKQSRTEHQQLADVHDDSRNGKDNILSHLLYVFIYLVSVASHLLGHMAISTFYW